MAMLLYSIGVLISVVGLMTMGFAFGIRDFEFGHSLIIAGAIAIVGGVIVFALAAVLRELRRGRGVVQAVQPAPPARAAAEVPAKAVGRMPLPTPTPPVVGPRGRAEPRLDAPETPAHPQRPDIFATIRAGREPMPEAENVPLSPTLSPRAPRPDLDEPHPDERRPLSPATLASRTAARIDTPRSELPRSERSSRNLFDTVWPTDTRRSPETGREPAAREPAPMPLAPERMDERPAAADAPHDDAPADAPMPHDEHEPSPEPPRASEPRPVAILKSGVIDGMAYTLYTDGSIEAQLPKGMMRFASIDELRQYLEKNS